MLQPGDLFSLMRAIDTAPELGPGYSFLGDYQAADLSLYSKAALFGMAYCFGRLPAFGEPPPGGVIRQALVASSRNLAAVRELHGAAALVGPRQRRYFMECASARQWLGLPPEWQPAYPAAELGATRVSLPTGV